jgi:hypothetical protein
MMSDFSRRVSDGKAPDSKVRVDILEQLSEIESPEYRVVLTLMLRMQDETNVYFSTLQSHLIQIHGELSKMQRSEDQIKQLVLNGHTEDHSRHHHWIDSQMKLDAACGVVLNRHGEDGLCEHARQMIEDKNVIKRRTWKVQDMITMGLVLILLASLFPNLVHYFK